MSKSKPKQTQITSFLTKRQDTNDDNNEEPPLKVQKITADQQIIHDVQTIEKATDESGIYDQMEEYNIAKQAENEEFLKSFGESDSDIDVSEDDEMDFDFKYRPSKVLAEAKHVANMKGKASTRKAKTVNNDFLAEYDLSDSDSEATLTILASNPSKKGPRVRRDMKSLMKDLSKRTLATEEREALHKQMEISLEDYETQVSKNNSDTAPFGLVPGGDDLSLSTDREYIGTDLRWKHRYSFINWKKKSFASLYDPVQFIEAAKECKLLSKFVTPAVASKSPKSIAKLLICSYCILSPNLNLPDSLLSWMCRVG